MQNFTLPPELGVFLGLVIQALVLGLITALTPVLVEIVSSLRERLKKAISSSDWAILESLASTAVKYAQQAGLLDLIKNEGEAKLEFALNYLKTSAEKRGIVGLKPDEWRSLIEAAYFDAFVSSEPFSIQTVEFDDTIPLRCSCCDSRAAVPDTAAAPEPSS